MLGRSRADGSGDRGRPGSDPERHDAEIAAVALQHGADADELLREVSAFRVALDADLTIAAAALEADAPAVARDVLAAERGSVRSFEQRLLALVDRDLRANRRAPVAVPRRRLAGRRRTAAAATAAALVGLAGGAAFAASATGHGESPHAESAARPPSSQLVASAGPSEAVATRQAMTLLDAITRHASPDTIAAAADALHATVTGLIGRTPADPALAGTLWRLLVQERTSLAGLGSADPAIATALAQADALLRQLAPQLPDTVAASAVAPVSLPGPVTRPSAVPTAATPVTRPRPSTPASTAPAAGPTTAASTSPPALLPFPTPGATSGARAGSTAFPFGP